jgi:cytochrome c oxidase assembly protein subunit 15
MDGDFIPEGYGVMSPFVRNMFENSAAIQFNHRVLAYLILGFALWVVWSVRRQPLMRRSALVLLVILLWQVGLGIWTLLMVAPLNLSLLHQFSSILLFLAALNLVWRSRNTVK